MSYILDALRKADRERELGGVPDLETAHWGVRRQQRSWQWLWIVAVLLVFNAGLLLYMLNRHPAEELPPARAEQVLPPVPHEQPVPAEQTMATGKPVPSADDQRQAAEPSIMTMRPKVAVLPHVDPAPAPAPTARVVMADTPLTDSADTAVPGLPEWSELPLELRSQFTLPHIDVYVYAEDPSRRFILVDLKKYREGDTLPGGIALEQIDPGFVRLNYQGTRFRLER